MSTDFLPISALQHLLFCPRQAALIHLERLWAENRLTIEGKQLHEKAHQAENELRNRVRIVRGLLLRSESLGLVGQADVVEFEPRCPDERPPLAGRDLYAAVRARPAAWLVTPIEYKRGQPKKDDSDRVQLCAQAMCLEEMLGVEIASGGLFYGRRRRRTPVIFDAALRQATVAAAGQMHAILESGVTPPAVREPKCDHCSLIHLCLPSAAAEQQKAAAFNERQFAALAASAGPVSDPDEAEP